MIVLLKEIGMTGSKPTDTPNNHKQKKNLEVLPGYVSMPCGKSYISLPHKPRHQFLV